MTTLERARQSGAAKMRINRAHTGTISRIRAHISEHGPQSRKQLEIALSVSGGSLSNAISQGVESETLIPVNVGGERKYDVRRDAVAVESKRVAHPERMAGRRYRLQIALEKAGLV